MAHLLIATSDCEALRLTSPSPVSCCVMTCRGLSELTVHVHPCPASALLPDCCFLPGSDTDWDSGPLHCPYLGWPQWHTGNFNNALQQLVSWPGWMLQWFLGLWTQGIIPVKFSYWRLNLKNNFFCKEFIWLIGIELNIFWIEFLNCSFKLKLIRMFG